ncbi:MAG: glycosyltransferase [Acidobacteria bacterium]|nr:glycosyltransferase [Acidobacteriota bacterium]
MDERIVILIPAFNDWEALEQLLRELDAALAAQQAPVEVLIVDDGSTLPIPPGFPNRRFTALRSVDILHLRRNLGHQRAIAVGLVYVHQHLPCRAVVLMDADGEDRPGDILPLMGRFYQNHERQIVFAARAKRLERWSFQFFYQAYRLVHLVLTGAPVKVGNFSVIPAAVLAQLVVIPEIWHHYAAAAIRARLAFDTVPIARGRRLAGHSKMNAIGLLLHGLSAIFVYADIVGARLFVGSVALTVVAAAMIAATLSVPGGRTYTTGVLCVILLQAVVISLVLVFNVIGSRANFNFLPVRDCPHFAGAVRRVFPAAEGVSAVKDPAP